MYQAMNDGIHLYRIEVMPVKKIRELPAELIGALDLPEEALLNTLKLSMTGSRRALVENHRGILDYSEDRVLISAGREKLSVSGSGLRLSAMNRQELLIIGRIKTVEWE